MKKIKHIILIILFFSPFCVIAQNACGDDKIMEDVPRIKDTTEAADNNSQIHDYSIILFGGAGPEFSLYKSKYISPVFIGGIEIPLFCSGRIALELIIDHIDTKLKWELGYEDSDNSIGFIYGLKFYFFETRKSRFSFRLGFWYYPIICPVFGFEYNYILNRYLELGASVYKKTIVPLPFADDHPNPGYFTINFRFKI